MSESVKLYREIQEIEDILKTVIETSKQKETTKTEITETLDENNDIISQTNIINYLTEALT